MTPFRNDTKYWSVRSNMKIAAALLLLVAIGPGCNQRQAEPDENASAQGPLPRTPANFRAVTTNMTLQEVMDRFGLYDRVRGSGISYFEYDFPDGSAVLLSPEWPYHPTNRIQTVRFYESTNQIDLSP